MFVKSLVDKNMSSIMVKLPWKTSSWKIIPRIMIFNISFQEFGNVQERAYKNNWYHILEEASFTCFRTVDGLKWGQEGIGYGMLCMFLSPNIFFPIWINIVLIYLIWETSRNKLQKHFVTKNCSCDWEKLFEAEGQEFAKIFR